jgi:hypothetical protein
LSLAAVLNPPEKEETHASLIPNPFHIFEQDFLAAAVIQFRGPAVCVTGYSLIGFQGAVVFQLDFERHVHRWQMPRLLQRRFGCTLIAIALGSV